MLNDSWNDNTHGFYFELFRQFKVYLIYSRLVVIFFNRRECWFGSVDIRIVNWWWRWWKFIIQGFSLSLIDVSSMYCIFGEVAEPNLGKERSAWSESTRVPYLGIHYLSFLSWSNQIYRRWGSFLLFLSSLTAFHDTPLKWVSFGTI